MITDRLLRGTINMAGPAGRGCLTPGDTIHFSFTNTFTNSGTHDVWATSQTSNGMWLPSAQYVLIEPGQTQYLTYTYDGPVDCSGPVSYDVFMRFPFTQFRVTSTLTAAQDIEADNNFWQATYRNFELTNAQVLRQDQSITRPPIYYDLFLSGRTNSLTLDGTRSTDVITDVVCTAWVKDIPAPRTFDGTSAGWSTPIRTGEENSGYYAHQTTFLGSVTARDGSTSITPGFSFRCMDINGFYYRPSNYHLGTSVKVNGVTYSWWTNRQFTLV